MLYKSKKPIYVKLDKGFPDKKYNEFESGIIKVFEPKKNNKKICIITTGVLKHEIINLMIIIILLMFVYMRFLK